MLWKPQTIQSTILMNIKTHTVKNLQAIMQLADELGYETKDLTFQELVDIKSELLLTLGERLDLK